MGLKTSLPAKQYFRRSGVLFLGGGLVMAGLGIFAAPDLFGRVVAGLVTALFVTRGILRLRKARSVSEGAVVHESLHGRSVGYTIEEPHDNDER